MLPNVVLVGDLVEDPVAGISRRRSKYVKFIVACSYNESQSKRTPKINYYDCIVRGKSRAFVLEHLKKGDEVTVVAELIAVNRTNARQYQMKFWTLNVNKIMITNKRSGQENKLDQETMEIKNNKLSKEKLNSIISILSNY